MAGLHVALRLTAKRRNHTKIARLGHYVTDMALLGGALIREVMARHDHHTGVEHLVLALARMPDG